MVDKEEDREYTDEELASYWEGRARECVEHDWSSDDYGKYQAAVYEQCATELRDRRPLPDPYAADDDLTDPR